MATTTTVTESEGLPPSRYLCLTILGYRKPGMSEEAYCRHMIQVSAPLTKDLMVKYGIHNPTQTRLMMNRIYDRQMSNITDYDCFSQVVFESVEHYKMMKEDPYYKEHLFGDHDNFADTERSQMTIGWIEEWINDGAVREGLEFPSDSQGVSGLLSKSALAMTVVLGSYILFSK
ncbi:EthD domain-containing protein [Aspergillus alliaceus]|uniref:EthD domain-containing protein n=1 Tax=Petromyces alliaceus TaxID=209559 RepID=A0A5N7BQM5_PETAA|nr:EthD domain-containing protein [Aspergillus alliaceus]